ncbi:MAG: phenylalanine--tRNA ligase subunit beta [Cyanobacteria bacterium]|nr:phenylalanine--tRNA ligase subunit beta [Cyanobacteriota bacterium]
MRVSWQWLQQFVNLEGISPEVLSEKLTDSGLEVESITHQGPRFQGVVLARVQAVDPHPNADKLRLVTVKLAENSEIQVVCGAPNVRINTWIAFAPVGAQVLSRKTGELFTLEPAVIRGVTSQGMICSLDELGLETRYPKTEDGIWILDELEGINSSVLGHSLKEVLGLDGDVILETMPTANRGDLMCMEGIAREVAALTQRELCIAEDDFSVLLNLPNRPPSSAPFEIQLQDESVCPLYLGMSVSHIKIQDSPAWLQQRLEAANVRSINNVVDITNYVMLTTGQPLHGFDANSLLKFGSRIGVRRAKDGEKMTTLDGVERPLSPLSVLITAGETPVALAGVMGGETSEVENTTTDLFLESAYFPAATTRRSAKSVGIRTEASARFERGLYPAVCLRSLVLAKQLLEELAGAKVEALITNRPLSELISELKQPAERQLTLRLSRLERILGVSIDADEVSRVLTPLGFTCSGVQSGTGMIEVQVPVHRQNDVTREIDLIEEVIRVLGFDRIPYQLPSQASFAVKTLRQTVLSRVRQSLTAQGLNEVWTNSLIGDALLDRTGFALNRDQLVSVSNSHSVDHTFMRQSLLPTLIEVAKYNQGQGVDDCWIFELGKTYFKLGKSSAKQTGVSEKLMLSGLLLGSTRSAEWQTERKAPTPPDAPADFYELKGVIETLLASLGISLSEISFQNLTETSSPVSSASHSGVFHPGRVAQCQLNQKSWGVFGELHPRLVEALKLRHRPYLFELDMEFFLKYAKQNQAKTRAVRLSGYPSVKRDMAFWVKQGCTHQEILQVISQLNDPLIQHIELFDEFHANANSDSRRSLAYRVLLQSFEQTLTEPEIDASMQRLREALKTKLAVEFR